MHIRTLASCPCDLRPLAVYAPHGNRLASAQFAELIIIFAGALAHIHVAGGNRGPHRAGVGGGYVDL